MVRNKSNLSMHIEVIISFARKNTSIDGDCRIRYSMLLPEMLLETDNRTLMLSVYVFVPLYEHYCTRALTIICVHTQSCRIISALSQPDKTSLLHNQLVASSSPMSRYYSSPCSSIARRIQLAARAMSQLPMSLVTF